jgi:hypothetical protein
MLKNKFFYIALILPISINTNIIAQTFGFGCLGFFSGYGGIAYQSYKADGLNQFVKYFNELERESSLNTPLQDYVNATGYRVGVNFFRASWEGGIIITAKGYYQSLSKTREASETLAERTANNKYELDIKNWAVGIDFGFSLTSFLSWKIVDGSVHFNNVSLTNTLNSADGTEVSKYKSDPGVFGYSVGTGIIISIIKDYISLEGLAGYTYLQIEDLKTDEGINFLRGEPTADIFQHPNFIESGGFTAVVQLNVGFPL